LVSPLKKIKLIAFLFVFFFILDVGKDLLLQSLLQKSLARATGFTTTIASLHVSLFSLTLQGKEILFYNPAGFEERNFARISDFFLEFDPLALLRGKYHFREVHLVLEELFIVKNREGLTNLEMLEQIGSSQKKTSPLQVDALDLTLLRVVSKNGKEATAITVSERGPVAQHQHFENLHSITEVIRAVFLKSLPKELLLPKSK